MIVFKESELARKYCIGKGIEIGGAAHNPFNIPGCLQVAPKLTPKIRKFWDDDQIRMCGTKIEPDIWADAENIPLPDNSQDFIITSHVIEHVLNPLNAFREWNRILKSGGVVFMIFPKRDAEPLDRDKPISTLQSFINQYQNPKILSEKNDHLWIFTLQLMLDIHQWCNTNGVTDWEVVEALESDDKVGNGHCTVCRKR